MRLRGTAALALLLALAATMVGGNLAYSAPAAQSGNAIRLKAVTFNPAAGGPRVPAAFTRQGPVAATGGYYLLQFAGPVEQAWKDDLAAAGAELLDYVPDYAFKVRMTPAVAAKTLRQPNVSFVGLWHPFYSIDPAALGAAGQLLLRVRVERGGDGAAVANAAAGAGASVVGVDNGALLVVADQAQLSDFAQALDLAWVEPYRINEKHDEYARTIIGANVANGPSSTRNYDGSTQTVAVADTGIGGGTAATAHPDIPASRVAGIFNWPGVKDRCFQTIINDGTVDVDSGHGTHVAGSVLSDGYLANGAVVNPGVAPAARLVFQATENYVSTSALCQLSGLPSDYYLTGLNDLYGLFQQAYTNGARIHANSWGSAAAGDYTDNSVTADDFIWDNKDFTITFSAGNEGIDANANGVIDNDSIGAPATAKNVITIGASENNRQDDYACDTNLNYTSRDTTYQDGETCGSMGGNNFLGTYGQRWGADYPANPIASDPTAGNAQQMAAFSSRGPTDDGRIKPDVVAPGTWILSSYSSEFQEGYNDPVNSRTGRYQSDGWGIARSETYKYFGGTSMSNPIAAGAAAVVRDYYNKAHGVNASAALTKATLINTAVDLLDENNDGANDNDFPIPNVHEGWGRINLDAATDGASKFVDNTTGLATGGSATYTANVGTSGPLKISLVWSDFASTASAAANLVNNLNLTVTDPTGNTVYRGNVFSGGWSTTGGNADTVNNVENVYLSSAAAGAWTITISGANVPQGPQPFALVVRGATLNTPPPPATPAAPSGLSATAASSTQVNLSWADNSTNETGFSIERCAGKNCTGFAPIFSAGVDVTTYSNTGLTARTTYRYRVRAFNAAGNSAYSNIVSVTTPR